MIDHSVVKVRKIFYNDKGFQYGILMPDYFGSIDEAFDAYSRIWMGEYCDKNGNIKEEVSQKSVDMMEEFTIKGDDHFYIGLPGTYAYEGITEDYEGYGCELDKHGFEKMRTHLGIEVVYFESQY